MQRDQAEAKYGFRLYQGGVVPGKEIRIVELADWDVEACGGTHLANTSEVGLIKVVSTERVQDGIERLIYAVGPYAVIEVQKHEKILMEVSDLLGSPIEKIKESITNNLATIKELRNELEKIRIDNSSIIAAELVKISEDLNGSKIIITEVDKNSETIIEIGNSLKKLEDDFIAVLHSTIEPRVVVIVSDTAIKKGYHAGKITRSISNIIGGGGGGKPHLGQGGGSNLEKFNINITEIKNIVLTKP